MSRKRNFKKDWFLEKPTDVYKAVLTGELKIFPMRYWEKPDSYLHAAEITRFLIEKILIWTEDDIKEKLMLKTFKKNKLYGMISILFNNSPYAALNNAYPDRLKPWELQQMFCRGWTRDMALEAIKWLVETKLSWDDEQIKNHFSNSTLRENGLGGIANYYNIYELLNTIYPERFKKWQIKELTKWDEQTKIDAIRWLIEDVLRIDPAKVIVRKNDFVNNGLAGLLTRYNNSPYLAIKDAYRVEEDKITELYLKR
ncbi:MAG: hypothetical protein AB7G87_03695 [Clostridia bacterium]